MKQTLTIIPLLFILASCATGYHPDGFSGGFNDFKLSANTYQVRFSGNGFTSGERAYKYAVRRAAELAKENGYRYFKVINSSSNVDRSAHRTPLVANTSSNYNGTGYGNYGYGHYNSFGNLSGSSTTTYSGGDVVVIERPSTYITIKLYKNNADGLLDSDVILSNFAKK